MDSVGLLTYLGITPPCELAEHPLTSGGVSAVWQEMVIFYLLWQLYGDPPCEVTPSSAFRIYLITSERLQITSETYMSGYPISQM
jgi:hypothetical protein